jgi:hypothetical protein
MIPFVLGHALYMKAIHGGKTKNDKIDSYKIAKLLMGGNMPMAYPYPAQMRATRDLLRRRTYLVRQRGLLLAHIQNTNTQYNLPSFEGNKISRKFNHEAVAGRFEDPSVNLAIQADYFILKNSEERKQEKCRNPILRGVAFSIDFRGHIEVSCHSFEW